MKIKKIISIILTVALCLTVVPIKADAKEETVKEFTEIRTIDDLYGINNNPEGNYRLMNDIDMSAETAKGGAWDTGHGWTPLKEFGGEFDGNGYRIKGMNIYGNPGEYVGLFSGIARDGEVYNLGMVDVNIGNLDENEWYYCIGAIAGVVHGGLISKCYSSGKIVCPNINEENYGLYAGGMAGYLESNYIEISDCYNTLKIDNSANAGSAYKNRLYIGGIIGASSANSIGSFNISNTIEHCYNAGAVSGSAICTDSVFEVYGYTGKSNYYLTGSATDGDEYAKALTPTQMSIKNMYTGFDFENTWEIDPNSSYKYPQLKGNRQQRVEGISIETLPVKLSYAQGEDIDTDGGTVKITYEGGYETIVLLTKDMISGYDMTAVGEQNVTVSYGGKSVQFPIEVGRIDVTSVVISGNSEMQKGTSSKLSASVVPQNATDNSIKWSSSDESKATVDADGNVTALATGEVTITAAASNGVSADYKINITASCVLLILDESSVTLYKGDTKEIGTKLSPIDTTDKVTWNSSNSNIASVDNYGVITAVSPGETTIKAKAGNAKASCQVIVKQNLSSFYIVGVEDKAYTVGSVEQNIKVTDGNVTLNEDEDYIVSYSDNVNVGTAEMTIFGIGYYEGSLKKAFKIISNKNDNYVTDDSANDNANNNKNENINNHKSDNTNNKSDNTNNKGTDKKITVGKVTIKKIRNVKGRKIEIQYNKINKADGYQIRYSLKSNMSSSKIKTTTKTKYTLTSLKKKKKYYIQVRAFGYDSSGDKVYGKWSAKKSVKINK